MKRLISTVSGMIVATAGLAAVNASAYEYFPVEGDCWSVISDKVDVPMEDILEANDATIDSYIFVGVPIQIPDENVEITVEKPIDVDYKNYFYEAKLGDGWFLIAEKNNVDVATLLELNGATVDTPIYIGDKIIISKENETASKPVEIPIEEEEENTAPEYGHTDDIYTVKDGDSWWLISVLTGVPMDALFKLNNANENTIIYPNDVIKLTGHYLNEPPLKEIEDEEEDEFDKYYDENGNITTPEPDKPVEVDPMLKWKNLYTESWKNVCLAVAQMNEVSLKDVTGHPVKFCFSFDDKTGEITATCYADN